MKCAGLKLTDFRSYSETDKKYFCIKCLDTVFPFNSVTDDEFLNTIGNNLHLLQKINKSTQMLDVTFTNDPADNSVSPSSKYTSPATLQKLFSNRNPAEIAAHKY